MKTNIALATDSSHLQLTPEDQRWAEFLRRKGLDVTAVAWDDDAAPWQSFDAVVVRSCWDYHLRWDEFHSWIGRMEAAGVALWNPPALLRWNSRKTYLFDLADSGVNIVPSRWIRAGETLDLPRLSGELASRELIIKPAVGASASGVIRVDAEQPSPRLSSPTAEDVAAEDLLVQPLQTAVLTEGEWSLIYFDGSFSHAVLKRPKGGDFRVQEELGGSIVSSQPSPELRRAAAQTLAALSETPLYARVDLVRSPAGPRLMEFELIEPWLFLLEEESSCARFHRGLLQRLSR